MCSGAFSGADRHFSYKVIPGNVGYMGEPGLTCALYVGTTVALHCLTERQNRLSTCING